MAHFPHARAAIAAQMLTGLTSGDAGPLFRFAYQLTAETREALAKVLREARSVDNDRRMFDTIHTVLAATHPDLEPVAVLFRTRDYDDGWFLVPEGYVYFTDEDCDCDVDFGAPVRAVLTEEFGRRVEATTVLVNLRTFTVEVDDYGHDNPRPELNLTCTTDR